MSDSAAPPEVKPRGFQHGLLWLLLAMGCGNGGCTPPPSSAATAAQTSTPDPDHHQAGLAAQSTAQPQAPGEAPLLPILNRDALSARVQAQRAVLGKSATLFEDGQGKPVPWISPQYTALPAREPSLDDDLLNSLPGSSGLGGATETTGSGINGNALGLFEPIAHPPGVEPPLQHFHRALRELKNGQDPDGKVRILVYGASHTDADVYPHYLRTYLQERFGNGGHGFVHVARPWKWYRHTEMNVEGFKYWRTEHAQRKGARDGGYFGLLGASLSAKTKRAFGKVSHRNGGAASTYDVYYLQQPRGGNFHISVDGKRVATVKTRAKAFGPGYHTVEVDQGQHTVEVRPVGNGEVRLFGMIAETSEPGVVVDTLGIGGTRAANMLKWDETIWGDNVRRRDPDLVILAYGTNEAMDTDQSIAAYRSRLGEVLERLARFAPDASCLLVGPGDFPLRLGDQYVPRPRLRELVTAQKTVAKAKGCGFWDTLAFMGGELSMTQWATAIPRMAKDDHIHLTRRGYVRMGMALVDAMMLDFDRSGQVAISSKPYAEP